MERVSHPSSNSENGSHSLAEAVLLLDRRVENLRELIEQMHAALMNQRMEKQWYTTTELAEAMGVSQYTVQERWCNQGRIDCEKDAATGKWRIPGHEYRRLLAGGGLRAANDFTSTR